MTPTGIVLHLVPGLLLAWWGEHLRRALSAQGALARIGVVLVQLSALGFALRGVFSPDPPAPAALATRLHALGWSVWWIAFAAGALLLAAAIRGRRVLAIASLLAALLVPALALGGPPWLAVVAWAGWWALMLWTSRPPRVRPLPGG